MSNYNQYYYKGDTINARVVEDGFAVDLRDFETRRKMYNSDYRDGVAKQLNSVYRRKFGHDSGISDDSLGLEILAHAELYDFTSGLEFATISTINAANPLIGAVAKVPIHYVGNNLKEIFEEANIGKNDDHRAAFDKLGEIFN